MTHKIVKTCSGFFLQARQWEATKPSQYTLQSIGTVFSLKLRMTNHVCQFHNTKTVTCGLNVIIICTNNHNSQIDSVFYSTGTQYIFEWQALGWNLQLYPGLQFHIIIKLEYCTGLFLHSRLALHWRCIHHSFDWAFAFCIQSSLRSNKSQQTGKNLFTTLIFCC